ncbi:MAG: hypothetical protein ABJF04_10410 [Reichenbachiella sp.]|uniref:hypothetical protein n=1 Tax=Reichenbachiella sp. TaxID=2184521 RepID=UPI003267CC5B
MKCIKAAQALVLLLGLFLYAAIYAQTSILFVGNSYTYYNEMPDMVKRLAEANGQDCEITTSVNGGVSLKDHWEQNSNLKSKRMIEEGAFDVVILQDQSMTPIRQPNKTLTFGKKLAGLAEEAGGQVLVFQTWSRKNNPDSQVQLDDTFSKFVATTRAKIAPVADAWHLAMKEYPNLELYAYDGSHPSEIGSYLTALIMYRVLFEKQSSGAYKTFASKRLPISEIKKCEKIADQVMNR